MSHSNIHWLILMWDLYNVRTNTESQNHGVTEVRRDLWRSSSPNALLKQSQLEPVAQDHIQTATEYLQRGRLHNLSVQPVPVLSHPHSEKVFPEVQREPAVFLCVPIASGPVTGRHWRVWLHLLCTLPSGVYTHWQDTPWAFSSPDWTVPALSVFPHRRDAPIP